MKNIKNKIIIINYMDKNSTQSDELKDSINTDNGYLDMFFTASTTTTN